MSIAEQVVELVAKSAPARWAGTEFPEAVDLFTDLGLASIDLIRLFSQIEARFDIELFDGVTTGRIDTVGELVALVTAKYRLST